MIKENISVEEVDAKLDKIKRLPRGSFKPKKGATDLKNCKVKITLYLDADILGYSAPEPNRRTPLRIKRRSTTNCAA